MSGAFAELFVSLGIKGSEKTLSVLSTVKTGMGGIRDTSLEAKAAILAAVYALEKMTTGSATFGYNIQSLATYLDIGTKSLQQWRYAAMEAGISNEEFDQSAKAIQSHIKDYAANGPLPKGSKILAQETKFTFADGFKVDDILPKLLEFAHNKKYSRENIETILEGWGLTPNEISQAIQGRFSAANLKGAPFLKGTELNSLSNVKVDWDKLEAKVKMFIAHLTAKDGEDAVKNLNKMADSFFRIANDIERISTKLGIFKIINYSMEGWTKILDFTANKLKGKDPLQDKIKAQEDLDVARQNQEIAQRKKELSDNINSIGYFFGASKNNILSGFSEGKSDLSQLIFGQNKDDWQNQLRNVFDFKNIVSPNIPMPYQNDQSKKEINVTQNISFQHPGKDIEKTKNDISRHIIAAIRTADQGRIT